MPTLLAACLGGCALLAPPPEKHEAASLQAPALPPDSVILEVAFARLPTADLAAYEAIWQEADEQHFPVELRRKLAANGVRCGMLGMQIPARLKEVLDDNEKSIVQQGDLAIDQTQADRASRRMQCRGGQRAKVLVTKQIESLSLLLLEDKSVRGLLLSDAQCLFGLKAYPQGDGRARLELTPEVEHGEMKTQYVGRDGSVLPQLGRDRVVLDQLKLEAMLPPGHVLMLSTTPDAKGMGSSFFVETEGGITYRRVLLVRLVVTQHDDLFAPDQMVSPLATPGE